MKVSKRKNITIEATLSDYKIINHHDITANILKLKLVDENITGLFIDEYCDLEKNKKYKIRGNIIPIENIDVDGFNNLIADDIIKYTNKDKILCITSIEKIKDQALITSIELSLYHNNENDLIELNIPISNVEVLNIKKISNSIYYLKDGKYDNITVCDGLELRLLLDKLSKKTSKLLLEDICVFSISLLFNNKSKKYYNLPYKSIYGEKNELQTIYKKDNKIIIIINER